MLVLTSFSIDLSSMMSYAEEFFNSLFPVFVPVLGIMLAIGIVYMTITVIKGVVRGVG
jgi:hypothetical protein